MGDSDDEHDRSRDRDKFRRERNDYGSGEKGRSGRNDSYRDRPRQPWRDDRRRSREEYDGDSRKRHSSGYGRGRDWSPPQKRPRRQEWDSLRDYPGQGMMTPYGLRLPPWPMPPPGPPPMIPGIRDSPNSAPQSLSRHMMLTFKQFLSQQDDTIDEMDAISSYNEYKTEFKRKQVDEFFENHKDEDWFMTLYHPTNLANAKTEAASHLRSRVGAFFYLLESERLDKLTLSVENVEGVVMAMDAAVIKMEGGTEEDLLSLEKQNDAVEEEVEGKKGNSKDGHPASEEDLQLAGKAKQYGQKKSSKKKQAVSGEEDSDGSSLEGDKEEPGTPRKEEEEDRTPPPAPVEDEPMAPENGTSQPEPRPLQRPLHLTRSIYIRHIPPKVLADDIIKVCKAITGYLRVAFAEATPDKGYERRGWVTFTHATDIRNVCAQLGALKVNDWQLACSVNRDLTRRVKHVSSITWSRRAVHSDLHQAIALVRFFDEKNHLWENAPEGDMAESNPILDIDESLLSEEEPVSMATGEDEEGAISEISNTDVLEDTHPKLKLLERLLWYLRLVHSLDYYNAIVFPSEDNMPHRCGIFTVRSVPPVTTTPEDLSRYCEELKDKVEPLMTKKKELSNTEMEKFSPKDPETEMERFLEINTEKISENKYLCPLSGKKFKGPEFVRKHIFNKHMDKVEAVKKEAVFFNNYLRDSERPMPLEASIKSSLPPNPKTPSADESPSLGMIPPLGGTPTPGGVAWAPDAQMMMFGGGGGGRGFGGRFPGMPIPDGSFRRGGRRGRRKQIEYHDLDAPDEVY